MCCDLINTATPGNGFKKELCSKKGGICSNLKIRKTYFELKKQAAVGSRLAAVGWRQSAGGE